MAVHRLTLRMLLERNPVIHFHEPAQRYQREYPDTQYLRGFRYGEVVDKPAETYDVRPCSEDFRYVGRGTYCGSRLLGSGTQASPYDYGAAPVSPAFAVLDVWLTYCHDSALRVPIYFRVNDCPFIGTPTGVTASDGVETRLA